MTIKEIKQIILDLHRTSVICFNTEPIKLPHNLIDCWGSRDITVDDINTIREDEIVENGYLKPGMQCQIIFNNSINSIIEENANRITKDNVPQDVMNKITEELDRIKKSLNSNECVLNFLAIECIIDIDDDIFELWDFHLDELEQLKRNKEM